MKKQTTVMTGKCPYLPPSLTVVRLGMDASLLQSSVTPPNMGEEELGWDLMSLMQNAGFDTLGL